MIASATQAIIPKARGMYSKRPNSAEFEELMRRRSVPELAVVLKRHPYFKESLGTLAISDPHRMQIEELLNMDIFNKYISLLRYDVDSDGFASYYRLECETREILRALQFLSIGLTDTYIKSIPSYLIAYSQVDLFSLGRATNFAQALEVLRFTPFYKPLRSRLMVDPQLKDFPATEAALIHTYYTSVFESIDKHLHGREARAVTNLFLQQIEEYNLELLLRIKTYFPHVYSPIDIQHLMVPYYWRIGRSRFEEMVHAPSAEALLALYQRDRGKPVDTVQYLETLATQRGRRVYKYAVEVLRLSASPYATLAAFVTLARLVKEDVVTVVEGVRYGLEPQKIREMLLY